MDIREVVGMLTRLGLGERQASVYMRLLEAGPSTASETAKLMGVSRPKAYRDLTDATAVGILMAKVDRPTVYHARPVEEVFDLISAKHERQTRLIERARAQLLEPLQRLEARAGDDGDQSGDWRVIRGRAAAVEALWKMLQRVEVEVAVVANHPVATHLVPEVVQLWDATSGLAAGGASVRCLVQTQEEGLAVLQRWMDGGVQMREVCEQPPMYFVVVDGREAFMWAQLDPSVRLNAEGDVVVWTDAPGIVASLALAFEAAWGASGREGPAAV